MSSWFSPLFFLLAQRSTEDELRRFTEFLKAENEMLGKRVPKQRIFLDNEERERLSRLGDAIGTGVLKLIMIVHPRTDQRWMLRKSQGKKPAQKMDCKGATQSLREIVIRLAKETG